jgi:hypothetical protein
MALARPLKNGCIRLGVIGAGWWATTNHMPLLAARDDVELAAVCWEVVPFPFPSAIARCERRRESVMARASNS